MLFLRGVTLLMLNCVECRFDGSEMMSSGRLLAKSSATISPDNFSHHHMPLLLRSLSGPAVIVGRRCASASTCRATLPSAPCYRNPARSRHVNINCCNLKINQINNNGSCKPRLYSSNNSTKHNAQTKDIATSTSTNTNDTASIEQQLSSLQAEIAHLSYLIKQTSNQQLETAALSRRAEARSYIIENKLIDIQTHVVKIPEMEHLTKILRQTLEKYSPSLFTDALQRARATTTSSSGTNILINKYTIWATLTSLFVFWQYRMAMYQRTSEEIADVAAMTLQQDALRKQIQETLATVANSPSTLASLSLLFQQLIKEERTQQHLIDLIVRALGSEGVRLAAIHLLDACFQNEDLQRRAGEFLTVAGKVAVLDEGVQKSAGVGLTRALKSAVLPWWVVKSLEGGGSSSSEERGVDNADGDGQVQDDDGEESHDVPANVVDENVTAQADEAEEK